MGHDIQVIANHRLDMSSARNLALDLSERLDAGIRFSFCFYNEEVEKHFWEPQFTINESKPKHYSIMLGFEEMTKFDPNFYFERITYAYATTPFFGMIFLICWNNQSL